MKDIDQGGPRYKHDCDVGIEGECCRFIGRLREYDLYVHIHDWCVETVARRSDEPSDYTSGSSSQRLIMELISDE